MRSKRATDDKLIKLDDMLLNVYTRLYSEGT